MAKDSSKSGVFRYLDVSIRHARLERMTKLILAIQGRGLVAKPTDYNAENFARSVMICDVHKRFASASFPQELRLHVMKAGIPYNTTCDLSQKGITKMMADLRKEAHDLLLPLPPQNPSYERDP